MLVKKVHRPIFDYLSNLAVIWRHQILPNIILNLKIGEFEVQSWELSQCFPDFAGSGHSYIPAFSAAVHEDESLDIRIILNQRCLKIEPRRPPVRGGPQIDLEKLNVRIPNDFIDEPKYFWVATEILLL